MTSYQIIEQKLDLDEPLPVDEQWSAAADFLDVLSNYCLQEKPRVIVECSSGSSSLVLARCCQLNQQGHVYSLENGEAFAVATRQQLKSFSLEGYCDVIHAPLQQVHLMDDDYQWYSLKDLPELNIDLLVIDGPPGFLQKNARYPALPLLLDRLTASAAIFLDDAARDDERGIVRQWQDQYPEFALEYIDNERGCSILRR